MGVAMESLLDYELDQETVAWLATPEGRAWVEKVKQEQAEADAARARQEQVWKEKHPGEWRAWMRLQPLLAPVISFVGDSGFDFDQFLREVGSAPSPAHRVVRKYKDLPYEQGNLRWKSPRAVETVRVSPAAVPQAGGGTLTKKEVAYRLRVSERTVNRWMSEGLLKHFRRGQVLRFKLEDVEAFEAKGRSGRR